MLYFLIIWLIWWIFAFFKPKWIQFPVAVVAMTIAPFVFYNPKQYEYYVKTHGGIKAKVRLHNHEMRHIWQQRFLSPLIMLVLYLIFSGILFVFFYFKTFKVDKAFEKCYLYNPFEIDARRHE